MDIELTELKKEFLEEAEAKIVEISSRLEEAGSTPPRESIKRMGDLAHQLKGAGGSYGYADISSYAAKLEDAIESVDEGSGEASSLQPLVDKLHAEIRTKKEGIESDET